jgi:hypothetical protein
MQGTQTPLDLLSGASATGCKRVPDSGTAESGNIVSSSCMSLVLATKIVPSGNSIVDRPNQKGRDLMSIQEVSAEELAELFHHYHQALGPDFGCATKSTSFNLEGTGRFQALFCKAW